MQQAAAALAAVDREREVLLKGRADAEALVRGEAVPGEDVAALGAFRRYTDAEMKCIAQKARAEREGARRATRRQAAGSTPTPVARAAEGAALCRMGAAAAKELEEMASESHLARWTVK